MKEGVVVRFDLEGRAPAVADVHDAGILTWSLTQGMALSRQTAQVTWRGFIGTVLRPHTEKYPQLVKVGSRSSSLLNRSYSSAVRLCCAMISGVICIGSVRRYARSLIFRQRNG